MVIMLCVVQKSVYSQGGAPAGESFYSGMTPPLPPAPTSASLGSYGNYQVDQFTGSTNISIPLYEIKVGDFTLPISLSYSHNSVKVNTMASWVGLGWSLGAGGVVTRTVRDLNDDHFNSNAWGYGLMYPGEIYYGSPGTPASGKAYDKIESLIEQNSCNTALDLLGLRVGYQGMKAFDTEPDIFYFNFNGRAGKFIIDKNLKPRLIPYSDLSITYTTVPITETSNPKRGWINSFTIIDEEGIKYTFSDTEFTETRGYNIGYWNDLSLSSFLLGGDSYNQFHSSWYLTKITLPTTEQISFEYIAENYSYYTSPFVSFRNCPDGDCENSSLSDPSLNYFNYPQKSINNVAYQMTGKRLTRIIFPGGKVDLLGELNRLDLANSYALTTVEVSSHSELVKRIKLDYKYFDCDVSEVNHLSRPRFAATNTNDNSKRLCLTAVRELALGSTVEKKYQFEYDERVSLPMIGSFQQDFWGFFNKNGAKTLVPRIYIYPSETGTNRFRVLPIYTYTGTKYDLPGAFRMANPEYISIGTLKRILFPTGGYTQYDMEPHDFEFTTRFSSGTETYPFVGGGMRVKKIVSHDGVSPLNDMVKEYDYNNAAADGSSIGGSSGRLLSMPIYGYVENTPGYNEYRKVAGGGNTSYLVNPMTYSTINSQAYYQKFLSRLTSPVEMLNGLDGINVAYNCLTEKTALGKAQYRFSLPALYGDKNDQPGLDCTVANNGICDGLYSANKSFYCELPNFHPSCYMSQSTGTGGRDADLKAIDNNVSYAFPYAPNLNYDWNRGQLVTKNIYDQLGRLVQEQKYFYKSFSPGTEGIKYVTGLNLRSSINWKLDFNGTIVAGSHCELFLFSRYKYITNIAKAIDSMYEKSYDYSSGSALSLEQGTKIYYKANNLLVDKKVARNSQNEILESDFNYVSDFASQYPYNEMHTAHFVSNPISEESRKNSILLGTEKLEYAKLSSGAFRPSRSLAAIRNNPLTEYNRVTVYSNTGYSIESSPKSGIVTSYIRDEYNNIVAAANGANVADIAYTSFETNNYGGWNVGTGQPVLNSSAVSGKRVLQHNQIQRTGLTVGKSYMFSVWALASTININGVATLPFFTKNGWNFYKKVISNATTLTITGTTSYDEARLYPLGSSMTTFTYKHLIGISSKIDENDQAVYYEYDGMGRLVVTRDGNGKVLEKICYNYSGQPENCVPPPNINLLLSNPPLGLLNITMSGNGVTYYFQSAGNGVTLASIPPGFYDIEISSVSGEMGYNHRVGCDPTVVYGNEVVMPTVELKVNCNTIFVY